MNVICTLSRKAPVKRIVVPLAYSVVFIKNAQPQSCLYQRQEFSSLTGHESVQGWTESLPLSFGVSSKTIKVVTEPQEMYNTMMVGLVIVIQPECVSLTLWLVMYADFL